RVPPNFAPCEKSIGLTSRRLRTCGWRSALMVVPFLPCVGDPIKVPDHPSGAHVVRYGRGAKRHSGLHRSTLARALRGPPQEDFLLAAVPREGRRTLELRPRLLEAAEFVEKVPAD